MKWWKEKPELKELEACVYGERRGAELRSITIKTLTSYTEIAISSVHAYVRFKCCHGFFFHKVLELIKQMSQI